MSVHDEIAKVAYELYEKSGRIPGHDLEHWLEAEKIVMARYAKKGQPEEEPTEGTTGEKTPVEPLPQPVNVSFEEAEKEAPKKKVATKKTIKKTEAKRGETKKVTKTKKVK